MAENGTAVPASRQRRWLAACYAMSLTGAAIGAVLKQLADRHRAPGVPVEAVLGGLAGLLFLAGAFGIFLLWLRWRAPVAFLDSDQQELPARDRRTALRAIRRNQPLPDELRTAGLRMARRIGSRSHWSIVGMLYWALLAGFNAAVQTGLLRWLWCIPLGVALGLVVYYYRMTERARRYAERER